MDVTEDLITFETPEVRERRLKSQRIKALLGTVWPQPNVRPALHHLPLSSPPSMIFTAAVPISSEGESSGENSFHSCGSATNFNWETFENDSTVSYASTIHSDTISQAEFSFDRLSVNDNRPTTPLCISNPFCSPNPNGHRRNLSQNLIELDDGCDVVRMFDPIISPPPPAVVTPKTDSSTVVRARQKTTEVVSPPLNIFNKGRFDSLPERTDSSASLSQQRRRIPTKSFTFADLRLVHKEPKVLTELKQLEASVWAKIRPKGIDGDQETQWSQGIIISPRSELSSPPWLVTSVKLVVHSPTEYAPLKFTCDVGASVESLIYQILYSSSTSTVQPASAFALKIWGKDEYLLNDSRLAEYVHVYTSIKLNRDIELSLVSTDLLLCQHMQQEADRGSSARKKSLDAVFQEIVQPLIPETLKDLLSFLTIEGSSLTAAAASGDSVDTQKLCQLLKALCAVFRTVVPVDLVDALDRLKSADVALSQERRTHQSSFRHTANSEIRPASSEFVLQFNNALQSVCGCVHRLITTFCHSSLAGYQIEPVEDRNGTVRELISIECELLFCAESLHNIPPNWIDEYEKFSLKCYVFYGTGHYSSKMEEIGPATLSRSGFYPAVYFSQWTQFPSCELCIIPREARLCFVLSGGRLLENKNNEAPVPAQSVDKQQPLNSTGREIVEKDHFTYTQLGWASVSLYDADNCFRQGSYVLSFSKQLSFQPWGPDSCSLGHDSSSAQLLISFAKYGFDVCFPDVDPAERSSRGSNNPTLDDATRGYLHDLVFNRKPADELYEDETEMLWEKRYGLTDIPEALPLVLTSAFSWDWASLNHIYHLLTSFKPLCPLKALELLLPKFPDREVRKKAVEWISNASTDELINYLPQLIEVLRFELCENSYMATLLLTVAASDWKFAHQLYWQLQQRCSLHDAIGIRCRLLQQLLVRILGDRCSAVFEREKWLLTQLDSVAASVKTSHSSNRQKMTVKLLEPLDHQLGADPVCLPIEPAFKASGFDLSLCGYFDSKTRPLDLLFKNSEATFGTIYKVGDDLRQDAVVIQLVSMMERIWLNAGLDLKILTFQCLPTGHCKGLVEKVSHSRTLRQIHVEGGGVTGSFRDSLLVAWIQKHNPSELDYEIALTNFRKSSSAWCVCTYVLGLGDRHNDNILITTKGHVFHIDFGKYMGDSEKFGSFKRDRVPFVLTSDMAYVINAGSKQKTTFQEFVDDCCSAFNCLRKDSYQLLTILKMMVCSGVPGMSMNAVRYIHSRMWLDRTDTEATARFTRMIEETLKSMAPRMNFFIHNLAQWKAVGTESSTQLLSFTPRTVSLGEDGKIVMVDVVSCEKRHNPEKHYLFKLVIDREQETVPTIIYRTYKEFYEFYEKLYMRFPLAELSPLPSGRTIGRSNIRVVAERQKLEIKDFLESLLVLSPEVAHCDVVYTFFHPLLRDQQEAERMGVGDVTSPLAVPAMQGKIKFSVSYNKDSKELEVFVSFVKNLPHVNGKPPDSYVKLYLRPDPGRSSKRKTKVEKSNCNPVFNERFVYMYPTSMIMNRLLELTVWQHDFLKENSFLGGLQMPLKEIIDNPEIVTNSWFALGPITRVPTYF